MYKVTIIIPTFRRPESLITAINSVLNQTYNNIEIIVVDDNNPETEYRKKTAILMQQYESNPKVRYICHDKNLNGAVARNTGIKASEGDFICFLDDDDVYYTQKVEEELNYLLQHPEMEACYCWRKQDGKIIKNDDQEDLSKDILLETFCPSTPALMFRKSVLIELEGFNPSYRRHQENELLLRFLSKYKIGCVKKVLVEIVGCDGLNKLHGKALEELNKRYLNDFQVQIDNIDYGKCKKRIHAHYSLEVSKDYLKHNRLKRGTLFFMNAFILDPIYTISKVKMILSRKRELLQSSHLRSIQVVKK